MIDNRRLVAILQSYGSWADQGRSHGERPFRHEGVWTIPAGEGRALIVAEADVPPAVAELLELYIETGGLQGQDDPGGRVLAWLSEAEALTGEQLAQVLQELGWQGAGAVLVAVELVNADSKLLEDAVNLLHELLEEEYAFVAAGRGDKPVLSMLLSISDTERDYLSDLRAWLDTMGAELYLNWRAGLSAPVAAWRDLPHARAEAQFALGAGRQYASRELIHQFGRLGVAGLFHAIPREARMQFVQEVLPEEVLTSLSAELRETIFAFLEHGQQVADTARSLYIHRNTLLYRLDRIAELTGYEIRKPVQGWTLWLALTLSRSQ